MLPIGCGLLPFPSRDRRHQSRIDDDGASTKNEPVSDDVAGMCRPCALRVGRPGAEGTAISAPPYQYLIGPLIHLASVHRSICAHAYASIKCILNRNAETASKPPEPPQSRQTPFPRQNPFFSPPSFSPVGVKGLIVR